MCILLLCTIPVSSGDSRAGGKSRKTTAVKAPTTARVVPTRATQRAADKNMPPNIKSQGHRLYAPLAFLVEAEAHLITIRQVENSRRQIWNGVFHVTRPAIKAANWPDLSQDYGTGDPNWQQVVYAHRILRSIINTHLLATYCVDTSSLRPHFSSFFVTSVLHSLATVLKSALHDTDWKG